MENRVNIMGVDIDIISIEELIKIVKEYLVNDYMNVIFLASQGMIDEAEKDKEFKEIIQKADLILPGDETLLSLHHVDTLKMVGMVVNNKAMGRMFEGVMEEEKTAFIVGEDENVYESYRKYLKTKYVNVNIVDYYWGDLENNSELIMNRINSVAPDILFFVAKTPLQEKWIIENSIKLNAKLCLGVGGVIDDILASYKEVPLIIKKLKLTSLYKCLTSETGLKKIFGVRIFKKKVEHYKNKKGDVNNGNFK